MVRVRIAIQGVLKDRRRDEEKKKKKKRNQCLIRTSSNLGGKVSPVRS